MSQLFQKIDASLNKITGDAYVSRFYSDADNIVVCYEDNSHTKSIKEILENYGYSHYDTGANGSLLMATFKRH